MSTFDAVAVDSEVLSPKEYLDKIQRHSDNIKSTEIVIPSFGSKVFGGLRVHYESPVYKVMPGKAFSK